MPSQSGQQCSPFVPPERYRINVRYPRELRDSPDDLAQVLVPIPFQRARDGGEMQVATPAADGMGGGRVAHVRLGQLDRIVPTMGDVEGGAPCPGPHRSAELQRNTS